MLFKNTWGRHPVRRLALRRAGHPPPAPQGRILLEITGKITNTNAGNRAQFDLPMLEKLGISRRKTSTAWTEGQPVFEGVLMKDLFNQGRRDRRQGDRRRAQRLQRSTSRCRISKTSRSSLPIGWTGGAAGEGQGAALDHLSGRRVPPS